MSHQDLHEIRMKIETRAQAMLNAMAKREFRNAVAHFDTMMTSVMPANKLEELWMAIQEKAGPFVEQLSVETKVMEGLPVVVLECRFAKSNATLYVTFDATAAVAGLHVDLAAAQAKKAPEHAPTPPPRAAEPEPHLAK